jgi:hypothetical protein
MPLSYDYKCNKCDFEMPGGWGWYVYVVNDKGERIVCGHPGECSTAYKVLGKNASKELIDERRGYNSYYVCLDCLHQFDADVIFIDEQGVKHGRDKEECPKCKSGKIKEELEMVGEICPKCKEGIIEEVDTGIMS